jgi:hypothetical protein
MFFPVNEITKRALAKRAKKEVQQLNPIERFISGAAAGLSYWVGTFPLDAIKSRIQATSYDQRKGWIETAKIIFKEGGFQGFARGLAPSAARSIPACATMFATGISCMIRCKNMHSIYTYIHMHYICMYMCLYIYTDMCVYVYIHLCYRHFTNMNGFEYLNNFIIIIFIHHIVDLVRDHLNSFR